MELILKERVENLGLKGDLVKVKPGYGRNFLIPNGKALLATPSMKKVFAENQRQKEHKTKSIIENAKKTATVLTEKEIQVAVKVGDKGNIFGSVTSLHLLNVLKEMGFDIERRHIQLSQKSIKTLGKYKAKIQLHEKVSQDIDFEVVRL